MVPEIADALETEGILDAFPIQALALPIALGGHDIIGQARTGTGKTFAFGIPLLQRIPHGGKAPRALIVVPTRELAIQVTDDLTLAGGKLGSRILSVYGGRAYEPQIEALKRGVDVVVGTPGRMLDLVKQKYLDLSEVSVLVLDEADRMLDLGFLPDIERIITLVPSERQTMLFSATMPGEIMALSRRYLTRPTNVRAESHAESEATPQVQQYVWQAHQMDKPEVLSRILQARGRGLTMVFCQTKRACDRVAEDLAKRGFAAAAVHGDLGQSQRERALRAFRAGKIDVLIATDVAARGLDVDDVTHVVNYECPEDDKAYVHRIGRTGRAGKEGIAVTFVDWQDVQRWKLINTALGLDHPQPEEIYSSSPELFEAMDIPAEARGILPKEQRDRAGLAAEELEDIGETGRTRSAGGPGRGRDRDRDRDRDRTSRPERTRRSRNRRRTRSGHPLEEGAPVTEAPAEAEVAEQPKRTRTRTRKAAEPHEAAPAVLETPEAEEKPRRTRTRRPIEAEAPLAEAEPTGTAAEEIEAEAPVAEEKPKRTRTRRAAEPIEAVGAEAIEAEAPVDEKPKRTRTRKAAELIEAEAPVVEEKPKRTRTRKAAKPIEADTAVVDAKANAAETIEAEAPVAEQPKRTRKAAEMIEAEAPVVEEAERTRKTVEAEAPVEEKPKRSRKGAETVEAAPAEAEAAPTARSRAAKPVAAAEVAPAAVIAAPTSPAGVPAVVFAAPPLPAGHEEEYADHQATTAERPRRRRRRN